MYRYAGGKDDWTAAGFTLRGKSSNHTVVDDLKTATTVPFELLPEQADSEPVYGLSEDGIALARRNTNGSLSTAFTTKRAHADREKTAKWMQEKGLTALPITDPDGKLLGVFEP